MIFLHDYRDVLSWRLSSIVRWRAGRYLTRYLYLIMIGLSSISNISLNLGIRYLMDMIIVSGRSSDGYEKGIFEIIFD